MARTVDVAVVTDGAEGAFVGHKDELIHIDAHNVSVVDTPAPEIASPPVF